MRLRLKVLTLAVAPLLLAIAAVAAVVRIEARALAEAEMAVLEPALRNAREAELRNYVELAQKSIAHLRGRGDERAAREALKILATLDFGRDGYFFVYDLTGRNLMHPRQPELVGRDLWNLRDLRGQPTIQQLIAKARAGGGFVEFYWRRPSTGRTEAKLGYVVLEPRWGWMLGTGLYLDAIEEARARVDREATRAIHATLGLIAVIAVVAAVGVAVGGLALNLSDQRDAETRLRALARQVVTSQETERARVARELHDGVSQLLVSVKFMLETAAERLAGQAGSAAEPLARGLERLNEVLREIRRISHGLRPALLDDLGLVPALSQTLKEYADRTGQLTQLDAEHPGELPEAVATALFRVVQEALTNVERHAGARSVSLSLRRNRGELVLTVQDDGCGFDPAAQGLEPSHGLGLSNMRERIETLGGTLVLDSGHAGTRLVAQLPASALEP